MFLLTDVLMNENQGDEVDYRGVLHRDGSVLMSVSLNQLKVHLTLNIILYLLFYLSLSVGNKCRD